MTPKRGPEPDGAEETAVREVEAAYDRAWRAGDVDGLLTCLRADAVLVNPRGEVARGHDEIGAALGHFLDTEARGSSHHSVGTRVSFVTDDVALVDGEAQVSGLRDDAGGSSTIRHSFVDVLVRTDGTWAIAHIRAHPRAGGAAGA
jgi:uncharacterized protein (TIGR02246 family)